ncbi:hypothetical protein GCM10027589_13270 [Actinocorallia lasiicapitis]
MGRPETRLSPSTEPLQYFAQELRSLRINAGKPSYRKLAGQANYSSTSLSEAARGLSLPSLDVTLAFVTACGGDTAHWEGFWKSTKKKIDATPESVDYVTSQAHSETKNSYSEHGYAVVPGIPPEQQSLASMLAVAMLGVLFGFGIGKRRRTG